MSGAVAAKGVDRPRPEAGRWLVQEAWAVAGLTGLAFALRLACLDQSLYADELYLYEIVHDQPLGQVFSTVHETEKTPPLGFLLSWLSEKAGSAPELLRLPSFAASVATVPLVYLVALSTIGRNAGLVAAAWLALSPFQIFYGTETRSYALVTALVVLSTVVLMAALDSRRKRWWALYALAITAAVYSHYTAVLVLAPQAAWALWAHRDRWREQLLATGAAALLFLPWLPSFIVQAENSADEARRIAASVPLTLVNVAELEPRALVGHPFVPFQDLPGWGVLLALAAVVAGTVLVAVYRLATGRARLRPSLSSRGTLLLLLAVGPFLLLLAYSLRPETSFLLARNLSVSVPYAVLLLGWLLTLPGGRLRIALHIIALALVSVGTVKMLTPDYQRPDAKDAAEYIDAEAPPGAPIADVSIFTGPPAQATRVYLERPHPVYSEDLSAVWPRAARSDRPVFLSFPGVPTFERLFVAPPQYARSYRLADEHRSPGITPIVTRKYVPR